MPTKTKKAPRKRGHKPGVANKSKWEPFHLVKIYKWARMGLTDEAIQRELKVCIQTFINWKNDVPEVRQALDLGRMDAKSRDTFARYSYERLPAELRECWGKILAWEGETGGVALIEKMLRDKGESVRQQLYLHALIHCNFSPSKAGAKVGVRKDAIDRWLKTNPDFAQLVEEISWHKGNYFEESLVGLVAAGDSSAIMFANRTFNRQRGYGNQVDVNVSGKVEHDHNLTVDLTDLIPYLSAAAQAEILTALRQREEEGSRPRLTKVEQCPEEQVFSQLNRAASAILSE